MDLAISIILGIALSAAVGFRIFVPFLVMSIAAKTGVWEMANGFHWMASTPALVLFATATFLEIGAYFIPWFDNALDVVAAPAAVLAGALLMGSAIVDMDPLMKWVFAIIAGGGTAGIVKGTAATARAASTITTAGIGNPVISTAETAGAVSLSLLGLFVPLLAVILILLLFTYLIYRFFFRKKNKKVIA